MGQDMLNWQTGSIHNNNYELEQHDRSTIFIFFQETIFFFFIIILLTHLKKFQLVINLISGH